MTDPTPKQTQYLEKIKEKRRGKEIKVHEVTEMRDGIWMSVDYYPDDGILATQALLESKTGDKILIADEVVWVDPEGREHFGPGEEGYDRFQLN